ncbi:MAG: mechanosensitive ion channel domain-containing protein [Rhodanobacteraceae bacterium]
MAAPIANQLQDTRDDTLETFRGALHRINEVLDIQLVGTSGVKLTIGDVIGAIVALLTVLLISRLVRAGLNRYAKRHKNNQAALYTLSRIVHYILLVIGVMIALSVAGIPLSKFEVFAGALGVGLGFGMQAIFSNFVSGLIILFDRSLKVGDFVELANGTHGEVRDIHIRATRVTTNDNIDILVPNSEFVTHNVINWTLRDVSRRQRIPFGVAYGSDKELVKKAALEAAREVPFTQAQDGPRRPQVWLTGFGDSALNFALVVWLNADAVKRPGSVTAAYNWALHNALTKYEIELPFPQRDLHVRSWFGLSGEEAREAVTESHQPQQTKPREKIPRHERAALAENDAILAAQHDIHQDEPRGTGYRHEADDANDAAVVEQDDNGDDKNDNDEPGKV